jgi:hypothetical protein
MPKLSGEEEKDRTPVVRSSDPGKRPDKEGIPLWMWIAGGVFGLIVLVIIIFVMTRGSGTQPPRKGPRDTAAAEPQGTVGASLRQIIRG